MGGLPGIVQAVRDSDGTERRLALAKLIMIARDEGPRTDALAACVDLCAEAAIGPDDLEPHVSTLLDLWKRVFAQAKPLQKSTSQIEWMIDDQYSNTRCCAEWLLDLMGHVPGGEVDISLRDALSLADPRLKLFAAVSLLRRLTPVDPLELEKIAASNEVRIILWEQLRKLNVESLMPLRWSLPEMLAASDLSRWVSHPLELGVPPEEVELMGTFQVEIEGRPEDVYLFRFREYPKPWEAGEGWKAGIAGPYRDGQAIGSCWSAFESWDCKSPAEHTAKLYASVNRCGFE
jgi:hypothetical protein